MINEKNSMKSTWRYTDRSTWNFHQKTLVFLDILPASRNDKPVPKHQKTDKIPYLPDWYMYRWILSRALLPLALQYAVVSYTGKPWHVFAVFIYYSLWFKAIGINQIHVLRRIGNIYGFLDGDQHDRDDVPDVGVKKVMRSLSSTGTFRPMLIALLTYDIRSNAVPNPHWAWLPLTVGCYGIALDFWFYWYHRLMHTTDSLWKYHRTHHLTKHPNPLMSLYADTEQEIFDIVVIPLMAYLTLTVVGIPFNFYDWWICGQFVTFSELTGHTGLRLHATTPTPFGPLLRQLDADLVIEDHDLHHRRGWKKSFNYGKHCRLWDRLFGTSGERIESKEQNVDYEHPASLPLW
ncbi:fatty acid hydroxylase superfamily protein [Fimicolochytrium jonesii]|uniref:fatty acid hydroxylase superfamily protein n=1 Tax=Fimicolochytrium jonesii TaxID=1396493 RepID=UPI0022FE74AD|nr:fatty acid hydroxylase superfamily protein [Fimicolochytrium jonesii]KAI8823054.1 fatty acid hydroxylase superfamily protein [Fimicolochytrium jonesii]